MERINVYRRKDGRWEGRISRGKGNDGKRKFHYFFAHTKEEVVERMRKFKVNEVKNNTCLMNLKEMYAEWLNTIQYRVKDSTLSNYKTKATKHIIPELGDKLVSEICRDDIYLFINKKLKNGLSTRYVTDIIILLKSIFKHACCFYNCINPLIGIQLPKKEKSEVQILDTDDENKLMNFINDNKNESALGIALALKMGIRIGELCALQWKDVNLKTGVITINKTIQRIRTHKKGKKTKVIITAPKSESSKRIIPIPLCLTSFLKEFQADDTVYVLSNASKPIEPRTMQYRFAKILKHLGLPSIHFHALRHMFASKCVKLGFDIKSLSEILGHSSVEITLNRYVHTSFDQKVGFMNRIDFIV